MANGHGGKREGAGRKAIPCETKEQIALSYRMRRDLMAGGKGARYCYGRNKLLRETADWATQVFKFRVTHNTVERIIKEYHVNG